jgi:hypothetical protein
LAGKARFVSLGIDSFKEPTSTTENYISQPHAETVVVADLRTGQLRTTAKSHPTSAQEQGLLRSEDLASHFFTTSDGTRVMVLGCHDLTIFNPRSSNARRWRRKVNSNFRKLAKKKRHEVVLHHPHTTDSKMTWRAAWAGLERELRSVRRYAGAGRYWYSEGPRPRSPRAEVLALTKAGPTLDFIVS